MLSLEEVNFLRDKNTMLVAPRYIGGLPNNLRSDRKAYYDMSGRCGLLSPNDLCLAYDSYRPTACESFTPCSKDCDDLRADQGLQPIILYDAIE